ncbi:cytochrome P450 [Hypoxylon sp. FL1284]|nr:cytochrome P450 [Hypoxylon sp. FL1284]
MEGILSLSSLVSITVGVLVLAFVRSRAAAWYRLRHVDGPWYASFSYAWMLGATLSGRQAASYLAVGRKYGALVRIGPNDLLTGDPEVVRRMNGARSRYHRSSWYDSLRMDPYVTSLFPSREPAHHDRLKAQLAFGYGGRENPSIEADVDEQLAGLVDLIRRRYVSTTTSKTAELRPLDFAQRVNFFTLDAITKIAYGRAFGYLATDSDVYDYIATTRTNVPVLASLADVPWLTRLVFSRLGLRILGPKPTDKNGMGKMMGVAKEVAGERFGPNAKDQFDMLGSFVRHGVSQRLCEAEILFQIIAGSDTTATALRGTMLNLLASPFAFFRLREEIDQAAKEGRISAPIKADEAKNLEYLQAVIYEGLRINVPFSGMVMKEVPPDGDTIDGKFIPGGTRIGHNTLYIQRSQDIFGPDADLFRPERWLGIDDEKHREMVNTVELIFGHGRWGCSGKSVAFLEMNKVYVELLRHFDFQLIDPKNPMDTMNRNMFFQKDMWVKVTERV